MDKNELKRLVKEIVKTANLLKNEYTNENNAPVNYTCIFSQSEEEFSKLKKYASQIGKIINTLHQKELARCMLNWSMANDLCLLASGAVSAAIAEKLVLYDIAAGKLIAAEAGASITNFGKDIDTNTTFIVSNSAIHKELIDAVGHLLKK